MQNDNHTTLHEAGRTWASQATKFQRERVQRVARVATEQACPATVLRFVFSNGCHEEHAAMVEKIFGGTPGRDEVMTFVRAAATTHAGHGASKV